jgi:hypothetical protein
MADQALDSSRRHAGRRGLEQAMLRVTALGGEADGPKGSGAGSYANCRDDQGSEFSIFQAAG